MDQIPGAAMPAPGGAPPSKSSSQQQPNLQPVYDAHGQWIGLQRGNGTPDAKPDMSWMDSIPGATVPKAHQNDIPPGKKTGVIANVGAGTSEGVAGMLGAPVDIATGAINLIPRGINAVAGTRLPTIQNPVGGSDWWKSAEGLVGADPRNVVPDGALDEMARAAGQGVSAMMLPGAVARAAPAMGGIPGAFQRAFSAGSIPGQAAIGATAGAAGNLSERLAPEPYKPLANFAGQMIGGGLPLAAETAARGVYRAAAPIVQDWTAPFTKAGRERLAGQEIANAASDLGAVHDVLNGDAGNFTPAVPGSKPTMYQLTVDRGLGNLERAMAKNNPDAYLARRTAQTEAQVRAVRRLADGAASPADVGEAFRARLAGMDAQAAAERSVSLAGAQHATEGLGGAVPVGADQQTTALQQIGGRLRGGLDTLNQAEKARVSRLYDAIDPEGTLALDARGIKAGGRQIAKDIPKNAGPMEGDAGRILGVMQMQPAVVPFREIMALRSRVTTAIAQAREAQDAPTVRRLSQMLEVVDDALAHGVENAAAADADVGQRLAQTIQQDGHGPLPGGQGGLGAGQTASAAGTASGSTPQGGTPRQGSERPGNAGGDSAVATAEANQGSAAGEPELTPNYTPEAEARYRAANAAHAERMATFHDAPGVGSVLAPGPRAGEWKLGDSQVAATIFNGGKGAAERIQAFLRAAGNRQDLIDDLKDYAAFSLRRAAEDAEGTLDPRRFKTWMDAHQEALSFFPELRSKFRNAAAARQTMDDAAARHYAARTAFEKSAAAPFLADKNPVATVGRILKSDRADATMAELARLTQGNPEARSGLRKAVVDYMLDELRSNTRPSDAVERALKPDVFMTFVRKAQPGLKHIMSDEDIAYLRNVARDVEMTQRSVLSTKLPGGSNTAQDLAAGEKHSGGRPSIVGLLVAAESAGEAAHSVLGPWARVAATVGTVMTNAMRQAGIKSINDLVAEGMLHPEIGRALLAKIPPGGFEQPILKNAARKVAALATAAAAQEAMRGKK